MARVTKWFSSHVFVGRSLCVHVMISELTLRLSRDATGRHKPEYVGLASAAMQAAIFFYLNGADSEPLLCVPMKGNNMMDQNQPSRIKRRVRSPVINKAAARNQTSRARLLARTIEIPKSRSTKRATPIRN